MRTAEEVWDKLKKLGAYIKVKDGEEWEKLYEWSSGENPEETLKKTGSAVAFLEFKGMRVYFE